MKKSQKFLRYVIIIALLAFTLVPFYLMINNSFRTTELFIKSPFKLAESIDFKNYITAFQKMDFLKAIKNSSIITIISVVLILITSSMAAWFLVRHNWKINKIIFAILIASMIVPFQALMIPLVQLYGGLELLNNKWILIYMYLGFGQSFAVFIFHGFIKNIPVELEEAAMMDGASKMQVFFKIVFPLLKPVMATVLILDVLWIWNDYLLPSLILLSPSQRTLPLSTYSFFNSYSVDFAPLMAAIVLTILPVLIVYLIAQKQIIEGVVKGAIK
jgi:raffinose/stachyose/melibiose transport system permease protein